MERGERRSFDAELANKCVDVSRRYLLAHDKSEALRLDSSVDAFELLDDGTLLYAKSSLLPAERSERPRNDIFDVDWRSRQWIVGCKFNDGKLFEIASKKSYVEILPADANLEELDQVFGKFEEHLAKLPELIEAEAETEEIRKTLKKVSSEINSAEHIYCGRLRDSLHGLAETIKRWPKVKIGNSPEPVIATEGYLVDIASIRSENCLRYVVFGPNGLEVLHVPENIEEISKQAVFKIGYGNTDTAYLPLWVKCSQIAPVAIRSPQLLAQAHPELAWAIATMQQNP